MRGIALAVLVLAAPSVAWADPRVHVVAAGDTLGGLAERYRVSVEQLRDWNTLEDDRIEVGQELTVEDVSVLIYRTVPGDTLGCIARRHQVSVERLREDNPALRRGVEVGLRLRIRGGVDPRSGDEEGGEEPVYDTVANGDNLTRIANRHRVTLDQLRSWNSDLDGDVIRVGARLVVGRSGARSASVGAPYCGHVVGARQLESHEGYVLRNPARSWATASTLSRLRRAFDVVRRRDGQAPRVRVHDLGLEGGGPIDDHRSHQSGRDVDLTYYQRRGCADDGCPLGPVDPRGVDVRHQWMLLREWLRRGDAEAIYVDYELQRPLYEEARRRGATSAELERYFQYPRGRRHREGIIRHFPNHRDHLHVRFACERSEPQCR